MTTRHDVAARSASPEFALAYASVDWPSTPLGSTETWSPALTNTLDVVLASRFPIALLWGPRSVLLYNAAYVQLIGDKHPQALGRPVNEVLPETGEVVGSMLGGVRDGGPATWVEDALIPLSRHGFLEECYFTFSYSAVWGAREIEGVIAVAAETTRHVVAQRRLEILSALNESLVDAESVEDVSRRAMAVLQAARHDFPRVHLSLPPTLPSSASLADAGTATLASASPDEVLEQIGDERVLWLPLQPPPPASLGAGATLWVGAIPQPYLRVTLSRLLARDDSYLDFLRLVAATLTRALAGLESRAAEHRAAQLHRSMAAALQRSLLPSQGHPGRPAISARYQPAVELAQVGGDWYDWFELADGTFTLVIGDVAGHDTNAAVAMAQVRHTTRGVAHTTPPGQPSAVLRAVDSVMQSGGDTNFASVFLGQATLLHEGRVRLRWSNAGHPPPALIDTSGKVSLLERRADLLLGVDDDTARTDHEVVLEGGSTLVLYTDGLIERRGDGLETGLAWLRSVLADLARGDVDAISDGLLAAAGPCEDDVALLVVRM